ncbi:hypothetical protein [Streptomyces sp. NPDC088847]|uniref:hypothetical protein n=1 Tax=Streptomyces sp. NPDC088847 TaxID=3365909 RepID=UPI0037FFF3AC
MGQVLTGSEPYQRPAHHGLTKAGGWLRLVAPSAAVPRPIRLVGVDAVIACHPTLPRALHA